MSPGANCCSSQISLLLKLKLWPMGQMIQLSLSSLCPRSKQNQEYSDLLLIAHLKARLRDDAKLLAHWIYCVSAFLFPVVNSTLLAHSTGRAQENLFFIMNFNRPMKARATALEVCICSFSCRVLRFQRSSTWPLEGSFLEMMSRKLLTTLANIVRMLKAELEGCSFLWTQTTEEKTSSGLLCDFPPCVFKKQ